MKCAWCGSGYEDIALNINDDVYCFNCRCISKINCESKNLVSTYRLKLRERDLILNEEWMINVSYSGEMIHNLVIFSDKLKVYSQVMIDKNNRTYKVVAIDEKYDNIIMNLVQEKIEEIIKYINEC